MQSRPYHAHVYECSEFFVLFLARGDGLRATSYESAGAWAASAAGDFAGGGEWEGDVSDFGAESGSGEVERGGYSWIGAGREGVDEGDEWSLGGDARCESGRVSL